MKQKVALARALIHEPPVLFLDEPTSGLDPLAARAVRELILSLRQGHRAIVLCTHDLDEAERVADKVAILRQGRMVAFEAPDILRRQGQAGALVRVELAAPCPPALEMLRTMPGVEMLRTMPGVDAPFAPDGPPAGGNQAEFGYSTREPHVVNPLVVERLVSLGARVVSLTLHAPSLEDVYASAVTGDGAPGVSQVGGDPPVTARHPERSTFPQEGAESKDAGRPKPEIRPDGSAEEGRDG
jgi:ABC-2 type transport system ATP-binding protein